MVVVVAGGVISTRDHDFILGRGENNVGKESRCCDAIFGPGNRITDVAVEVLRLICDKREGGRRLFSYNLGPPPRNRPQSRTQPLHAFLFFITVLFRRARRRS